MPKTNALLLCTLLSLTACATAPNCGPQTDPVKPPTLPPLVWDAPARDWQGEMRSFLLGFLPTQPDLPPSLGAALPVMTLPSGH